MLEIIDARGGKNKAFFGSALNLKKHTRVGIRRALHRSGIGLTRSFKKEVRTGLKTGKIYGRIRASAKGETPANRTGKYAKGIGFRVSAGGSELVFGNNVEYAGYLELGTSRMKKRPGLGNAISDQKRNIIRNFVREISESI